MIQGLSHITFIVSVLDARKIYDSGDKTFSLSKERFFDIAGLWIAIMQGDPLSERTYNHVAFKMEADEYEERLQRIQTLGLQVREGRSRVGGEGHSIYFHDYDNHLFELHSGTLQERLQRYNR